MNLKFRALKHFNYELPANQKEQCNMCNKYVNADDAIYTKFVANVPAF